MAAMFNSHIGPPVNSTDQQQATTKLSLADLSLMSAAACAAAGAMSISQWNAEVSEGRAPAPAVQKPRFTRWRVCDVKKYLLDLAERDPVVTVRAKRASDAARVKRTLAQSA